VEDINKEMKNIQLGKWSLVADYFYDFAAVVISTCDIITDILVVREFYIAEKYVVAYTATALLICAQISYVLLFWVIYIDDSDKLRDKYSKQTIILLTVVPFGQLVPLFMWIEAHRFVWLSTVLEKIGLLVRDKPEEYGRTDDLLVWIQNTFRKHGGFVIEAFLEALPQSILQMVAILYYQEATPLSICSIILSMTSVASKGIIMSYSMNWHSFVFNCLCFAADIFGIFASLSWVFYKNDSDTDSGFVNDETFAQIWFYQLVLLFCALCAVAVVAFITKLMQIALKYCFGRDASDRRHCSPSNLWRCLRRSYNWCAIKRRRKCHNFSSTCNTLVFLLCLGPGTVLFYMVTSITFIGVLLMIIQIFKLFPLRFTTSEGNLADNITFYLPWFSFLLEARSSEDRDIRFAVSYKTLALESHYQNPYSIVIRKKLYEDLKPKSVRLAVMGRMPRLREWLVDQPRKELKRAWFPVDESTWWVAHRVAYVYLLGIFYLTVVLIVPLGLFSTLYNMVYPIIALAINGVGNQQLSVVLTFIYLFFFMGIILLAPETYRYRTMLNYATMISPIIRDPSENTANLIKERYYGKIQVQTTEILVRSFFGELAPLVLMYLGEDAECATYQPPSGHVAKNLYWKTKEGVFEYTAPDKYIWDYMKYQPIDLSTPSQTGPDEMVDSVTVVEEKIGEEKEMMEDHVPGIIQTISQNIDEVGVIGMVRETAASLNKKYGVPMPLDMEANDLSARGYPTEEMVIVRTNNVGHRSSEK